MHQDGSQKVVHLDHLEVLLELNARLDPAKKKSVAVVALQQVGYSVLAAWADGVIGVLLPSLL